MKSALNEQKKPKTIFDMTDSNLEKDNKILIVFSTNISDITGHQITV